MNFPPCPVCFPEWHMAQPTIEAELAFFINCLKSIGEPYLGTSKHSVDLLCKSIGAAERRLPLTSSLPMPTLLRCEKPCPDWWVFLFNKAKAFITRNCSSGIIVNYPETRANIIKAQRRGRKLNPSEIFDATQLLVRDFKKLCASVHGLQRLCILNPSPIKAETALERVKSQYNITMHDFKFLRAGLPQEVNRFLMWRGTP